MATCLLGITELRNFLYPRSERQLVQFSLKYAVHCYVRYCYVLVKGKRKVIPLQARCGPGGG